MRSVGTGTGGQKPVSGFVEAENVEEIGRFENGAALPEYVWLRFPAQNVRIIYHAYSIVCFKIHRAGLVLLPLCISLKTILHPILLSTS